MAMRNILWLLVGILLASAIIGGVTFWRAVGVVDTDAVNQTIQAGIISADEERKIIERHKLEAAERVVVIREQVRQEVLALGPDSLADFARNEIRVFRGRRAGDSPASSAAGLDGAE
jgi:hypothetical protein